MGSIAATAPFGHRLSGGFYTVPQAACLIRIGNEQRIRGWLQGYSRSAVGPLLHRDYAPISKKQELSFLDLMQVRFVEHFREAGVKARSLRRAAVRLRQEFEFEYPFATDRVVLVADKADVFVENVFKESAEAEEDRRLLSLLTNNYTMYEAIKQSLLPGVRFDPKSRLASMWAPRPEEFPTVLLNPLVAYGQPAVPEGIPTAVIFNDWQAEDEDYDAVAYWHDIPITSVRTAIGFERRLRETYRESNKGGARL